jgi:hypothetical protein
MIIDGHVHIFPEEVRRGRERFCSRDRAFAAVYGNPAARMASAEDVLQALDDVGADGAVACGFPWRDASLCREHNDYVAEACARHRGRLVGLGCVAPWAGEAALQEAERCLRGGLGGIGEVAAYGGAAWDLAAPFFGDLAALLTHWGKPLLLHVTEPVGHTYPGKDRTDLEALYAWILSHPDLDVVLAHWGGGLFFYELMPEVRTACRRVCYDTAASPFLYRPEIYRVALEIVGGDRLILGSDYPLIHPRRYLKEISGLGLPEADVSGLLGANAARLFGWAGITEAPAA